MSDTRDDAPETAPEVCELPVHGMTCASCASRVERALASVEGVEEATVNLATERATVRYDAARTDPRAIGRAIEDAGYRTNVPEATPSIVRLAIGGMTCASCVGRVERALAAVPGVLGASVDLATERATVTLGRPPASPEALVAAVREAGYRATVLDPGGPPGPGAGLNADPESEAEATERAEHRALVRDAALAAGLTIPLLVLGMSHGAIPGADGPVGRAVQLVLATVVVLGPGRRFFRLAWAAARHRTSDMNTLVALGTSAAYGYSAAAVLVPGIFPHGDHVAPHVYFEAAGAIVTFVLVGKWLEARAKRHLGDAVRGLMALTPATASRLDGDEEREVPVEALVPGEVFVVRPGERVAVDGEVIRGRSAIDESMLTGESMPVDKAIGARVYGGTMNHSGALTVRVEAIGRETALARIVQAVEQAQGQKAPVARLADRVSAVFVPVVLAIASIALVVWGALDPTGEGIAVAVERFVAVLVIACPCALGLATPAAIAVGTGRGAELGVLFKGGAVLETASRIQTVLFDKTGTLTIGEPALTDVVLAAGADEAAVLSAAAALEAQSEHPVAAAIVAGARDRGAPRREADDFASEPGLGVEGRVDGRDVRVGTREWLARAAIDTTSLEPAAELLAARGRTPSFVALDGRLAAVLGLADEATPGASGVVRDVTALGMEIAMVTGDRATTARAVARDLGIARVIAQVAPDQKAIVVEVEQARGRVVAMVGDGVNDAPALARADVGVAIGHGADVAVAAADVALLGGGIAKLPTALRLARATMRTIRRNLVWAFAYNVVGIPLAAGVLYPVTGWLLSPIYASAAMALSSVSVLLSSLWLRRFERAPARRAALDRGGVNRAQAAAAP